MMDITGFKANHGDFTFWDKNLACKKYRPIIFDNACNSGAVMWVYLTKEIVSHALYKYFKMMEKWNKTV